MTYARISNRRTVALATMIAVAAAAGCMTDGDATGQVALPVTTTGSDGATYRMPAGTLLHVTSGDFAADLAMDVDEAAAVARLPVGDYQAVLTHPAGYTTSWPLLRTAADGEAIAAAELLTAMPMPFAVVAGETTSLTLRMRITGVGDVVFASGTVDVSVTVETVTGDAADAHYVGLYQETAHTFDGASPALQSMLTFGDGASLPFVIDVHLTSPWVQTGLTTACVQIVTGAAWGEGHAGWQDGTTELIGGVGVICVDGDEVRLYTRREGPPRSALALELTGDHGFWLSLTATVPAAVFDGTTLSLSALAGATPLQDAVLELGIDAVDTGTTVFQTWGGTAGASLQLTP